LIYPFLPCGIVVWGQSVMALTRWIFTLQKRAIKYMAGLKQLESSTDSFRQLKTLHLRKSLICKRKCDCKEYIHITQEIITTITAMHIILNFYNSKPSAAHCTFHKKLPNIKQIGNNNQLKSNWRTYLLRDAIIQ
jgi:hypothetical protein